MSIGIREHPLSFSDFLDLERKTLKALHKNSTIQTEFPNIYNPASAKAFAGNGANGRRTQRFQKFGFECCWNSVCEFEGGSDCRLILQEQVTPDKNSDRVRDVTFCLCVALLENKAIKRVLRKFHFDFTLDTGETRRRRHPIHHAQYGGKAGGDLGGHLDEEMLAHLTPALSEPRVFYYPMTLAIALSLGFREFQNEHTKVVLESADWLNVVRENESRVIRPFLVSFVDSINSRKGRDTLFDFLYTQEIN